ncbi:N-6 DNA methylase [Thalassomonas sp. RHCl1]|uniref:N-6 DNA methylase n=1 Tax=Thalassomonas sp. RHCl1 TaxID=2995320 RepID=UPI00248D0E64|nr:N-6 DNA methylase [Thalassomonas sp. RHCl1]
MSPHCAIKKRELGAYYTPPELTKVLVDWAIRSSRETVLEPSFGGCGFLESCKSRLEKLGTKRPFTKLFGVDIDDKAFDYLHDIFGPIVVTKRFIKKDFIGVNGKEFSVKKFDVLLGNPPYVSLHNMTPEQRERCFKVLHSSPFADKTIGRNASLWGFFLLHSLSFIRDNGRMIWVLPSSLLHTHYAKALIEIYKKHFSNIKLIKLNQRFFKTEGTEEVSVILAAEGFSQEIIDHNLTGLYVAKSVNELSVILNNKEILEKDQIANHKLNLVNEDVLATSELLKQNSVNLGDISKIVIGMVTGANDKFVIKPSTSSNLGLSAQDIRPVISKFKHLSGIIHDKRSHEKLISEDERCLLVCPSDIQEKHTSVRNYLATIDRVNRKTNRTFPKRKFWFYPDDEQIPDAFLSYMIDSGPRLVINSAKINCTNTIHRVFFNGGISFRKKKALAISMLSSYTRFSAEIVGRSYGSGVLKLEPSAAKQLSIIYNNELLEPLLSISKEVNDLLSRGLITNATTIVDELLTEHFAIDFKKFSDAVIVLRKDRYES